MIRLLSHAGIETIAVTRQLGKAIQLPFVHWVEADIADKNSLYHTMAGSQSVFLLSGYSPDFVTEQLNVIEVAKECGATHIVKLSSGAADKNSSFYIPRTHGEVEDVLISSGIHYTMLRPNGIMQNWLGDIAESIRKERRFYEATGDGKRAYVDLRDVASVAFECLMHPGGHYDKVYMLTGDRAVNYSDVAQAIGSAIHEPVAYIPISLQEARQAMEVAGMPHALVETFLSYDAAQRNGATQVVSDSVRTILGKPARTLEEFVVDYADCFR